MKIVGFWLRNLSALAGAERKLPPSTIAIPHRSKAGTSSGESAEVDPEVFPVCAGMMSRARASFGEVGISNVSFRPGRE